MKKLLRCLPLWGLLFLFGSAMAQKNVTGSVTSAKDGDGISNASVTNKKTNKTVLTNNNGSFVILASDGDVLEISNVGYFKKAVTVSGDSKILVVLEVNTKQENTVMVTAFGQKKDTRSQGYGSQNITGTEIAETQRDNWMNALQGKVAGATINLTGGAPGASSQIVLRGFNSIGGDNSALIVLDGVILNNTVFNQGKLASDLPNRDNDYSNRAADINPEDIESITVLRGPEAAALYGTDAASGAIIITTKKGKIQKMKVGYDNNFRWEQITRFHTLQTKYDNGANGLSANTTRLFFGPEYAAGTKIYNNAKNFFNIGKAQTHNITLDGGRGLTSYRINGAYYNQDGVIPNSGNRKINFRATTNTKLNKKIEITNTVAYYNQFNRKAFRGAGGYYLSLLQWPLDDDARRWQNIAGNRRIISKSAGVDNPAEANNPFFEVTRNKNFDFNNRVTYNANIVYTANSWLTFDIRGGADGYSQRGLTLRDREDYSVYTVGGRIEQYNMRSMNYSANLLAIARKQIGDFKIKVMVGNAYDDRTTSFWSERVDSLRDEVRSASFNDLNISYGSAAPSRKLNSRQNGRDTLTLQRSIGAFFDINLAYKNFLYLNASGRNDWLAEFPAQSRSYFYPAVNTSFVFSELLPENKILSLGRLRASWANTGKRVAPYSNQSIYTNSSGSTNGYGYGFGFGLNNPNLFPETQTTVELGSELKFFKDRLSIDFAAYKVNISNSVAANARPSYATGGILYTSNIADLENKGIELIVGATWVKNKKFDWTTRVTFATTRNQVTRLDLPEFYNSDSWLATYRASLFRGLPTTTIGGLDYLRNNKGDIMIDPGTGYPLQRPQYSSIGDRNPDYTGGITNTFRYKNVSLGFTLDYKRGGDVLNGTDLALTQVGLSPRTLNREQVRIIPGVLQDGLENSANPTRNTIPINPNFQTDYYQGRMFAVDFIEKDIHWLRLRDVSLKYAFGKKALTKLRAFSAVSVFVTGTDLFIITNYSGLDPSANGNTPASGGVGSFAIDLGNTPVPIGINAGIRVSFKNNK
jgi:TonB-linked SusC/RagA family outer membrane protein